MKFTVVAAIMALTNAQLEESEECEIGGEDKCAEGLCCGTASAQDSEDKVVCNTAGKWTW